eukprot:COSAG01_NODE_2541_length_7477_cov_3.164226_7_plen_112_part_00
MPSTSHVLTRVLISLGLLLGSQPNLCAAQQQMSPSAACQTADVQQNGVVDTRDLLWVLAQFGDLNSSADFDGVNGELHVVEIVQRSARNRLKAAPPSLMRRCGYPRSVASF